MASFELPIHDLVMSEPAPSEVHQFKGKTFYCWLLSDTERSHIADMLQMDGKSKLLGKGDCHSLAQKGSLIQKKRYSFTDVWRALIVVADLSIKGANFTEDRAKCRGCGKHSGFDDFVHNALYAGVHSVDFMKDYIFGNISPGAGIVGHELTCSRCATKHENMSYWDHDFQWRTV